MLGRQMLTVATAGSTMNSMAQVVECPVPDLVVCPVMCFKFGQVREMQQAESYVAGLLRGNLHVTSSAAAAGTLIIDKNLSIVTTITLNDISSCDR